MYTWQPMVKRSRNENSESNGGLQGDIEWYAEKAGEEPLLERQEESQSAETIIRGNEAYARLAGQLECDYLLRKHLFPRPPHITTEEMHAFWQQCIDALRLQKKIRMRRATTTGIKNIDKENRLGEMIDLRKLVIDHISRLPKPPTELGDIRNAEKTRSRFVRANMRLVLERAKKYRGRGLSYQDLIQEAHVGLMRAIETFDPTMGYKFCTYAEWWIKHCIEVALRNQRSTIRIPLHQQHLITQFRQREAAALCCESGAQFSDIAKKMIVQEKKSEKGRPMTEKEEKNLKAALAVQGSPTLHSGGGADDSEFGLDEVLIDPHAKDLLSRSNLDDVDPLPYLMALRLREQKVLDLRFGLTNGETCSLRAIARVLRVSKERVRQIQNRALGKLRKSMGADGDE